MTPKRRPCPFEGCSRQYIMGMHDSLYAKHIQMTHLLCSCGRYMTSMDRSIHINQVQRRGAWGTTHPAYIRPSASPEARREFEQYQLGVARLARAVAHPRRVASNDGPEDDGL